MSTKTVLTKTTFIFVLIAMICPTVRVRAADSDDALLKALPSDCVFCLRINNFNQSLGKLDQYLGGVAPIPVSLAMMVNMQLGAVIGDPMMSGIDLGGDFAVFAIPPQADEMEPAVGILIPMTDYKTFVTTNPNCTEGEGGIATLSAPNSPVGGFLMTEAGNGKYALVVSEMADEQLPALKDAIAKSSKPLAQRISASQAKDAVTAPAWVYVDLAGLYEKYSPMIDGAMQSLQQEVDAENAPAQMAQMKEMMSLYFKVLPEIVKELGGSADSMTLALTPEPMVLSLDFAIKAKDGSKLAEIFVQNPKADGSYEMTGYLDNSNAVNGLSRMHMGNYKEMCDLFFDPFEKIAEVSQFKDAMEKFRASLDKFNSAMGDEVAFSFSYGDGMPPFKFVEVIDIKNPDLLKEYTQESMGFVNEMYKFMGIPAQITYQQDVSTYKNAAIDTMSFSFSMPNDPNMQMGAAEKAMLDNMKYYMARTPDKYYMAMGANGEAALKALIDKPAAAASGDIKIAMDTLKDTSYKDFVCSVNVIKLMKGIGEMMGSMAETMGHSPEMAGPAAMFSGLKNVETQSCLVMGGKTADGEAAMRLAVPKQHLIEIVATAMQIMTTQQEQQQANFSQPEMFNDSSTSVTAGSETQKDPLLEWIGKPAPELKMTDLEGNIHRLSRMKGKKVILDFWATWCPPCKKAIPDLIKLRSGAEPSDLMILGLSDEPLDKLNPFIKEQQMNYPVIAYEDSSLPEPYKGINALPTAILIDSNGILRDVLVGYHPLEELQKRLNALE